MIYREDKYGNKLSALGLGCMRFPRDKSETERMILRAIERGVNFFDTAYIYPNSEVTLGSILSNHDKRKDVYISTKLPLSNCKTSADFDRFFDTQLRRLQTDYIDYYFMHNMTSFAQWEWLKSLGIEAWLAGKKSSGAIKQAGFSFHGTCDEFTKIIADYDWDFTLIQHNYYDEHYQAGTRGLHAAAEKGMAVMIMEPLLGGRLAMGLPKSAVERFRKAAPDLTSADHGLWWLWNRPQVTVVLSGMNSTAIMDANIDSADKFRPLSDERLAVYDEVVADFRKTYKINCTGCGYCVPCPKGINIPGCFSAYNTRHSHGLVTGMSSYLTTTGALSTPSFSPRICTECGKCEKACPQNLPIRRELKRVGRKLEPPPIRWGVGIARKFFR
ncbi:MAG: aldo/keto reductase [Oscillospiraceae bacterium]|nr:aldo/keto reductase [Oscillospiraceae bacterium]